MINKFVTSELTKYESLGNSFFIVDLFDKSYEKIKSYISGDLWIKKVKDLCDKKKNEGADGVLVIYKSDHKIPGTIIFNSDGTDGQLCLNGARCIAKYLHKKYPDNFSNEITIFMGNKKVKHTIKPDGITQYIPLGKYLGEKKILGFNGFCVDVGNPHFIIFQEQTTDWLKANGKKIENHKAFPNKTNVEFVWPSKNHRSVLEYNILIYERGCGITKACSSGAAAVTSLMFFQKMIESDQKINLCMPGGKTTTWVTKENLVLLPVRPERSKPNPKL